MDLHLLTAEQVTELWPQLESIYDASCASNEIVHADATATQIYLLAQTGMCGIFAAMEKDRVVCTVALRFCEVNGNKGAEILGMGGRNLMKVKAYFWQPILDWLCANGATFLDTYANQRLANIYLKKFGFNKSCTYVRMDLQVSNV
jgi:hypothetical protein